MAQGKAGWWIAGACAGVVFLSIGYGMGRKSGINQTGVSPSSLSPAGVPVPAVQIEPIQPQQELAAISPNASNSSAAAPSPKNVSTVKNGQMGGTPDAADGQSSAPKIEESARIREVQQALKTAGFDPGTVDGRMGARTKMAVHDFQVANGLEPDGKVGPRTWAKLETFLKKQDTAAAQTSNN